MAATLRGPEATAIPVSEGARRTGPLGEEHGVEGGTVQRGRKAATESMR